MLLSVVGDGVGDFPGALLQQRHWGCLEHDGKVVPTLWLVYLRPLATCSVQLPTSFLEQETASISRDTYVTSNSEFL